MSKIIVISGHPNVDHSFANKAILEALAQSESLPDMSIHRLDLLYPDFNIDVAKEQALVQEAEVIVLQFPFYWYGFNALLRKWIEDVFVFGFAHGVGGDKVKGKQLFLSFTTGAAEELYAYDKAMNYPMADFLPPMEQFANLCQMQWHQPVISYNMQYIPGVYPAEKLEEIQCKAQAHAEHLTEEILKTIS